MPLNDFIDRIVDNGISVFADHLLSDYPIATAGKTHTFLSLNCYRMANLSLCKRAYFEVESLD